MANTKTTGFRFRNEILEKMDFLCEKYGTTRTELIGTMVTNEFDKYHGNPELQKVLAQMKELEEQFRGMRRG